MRTNQLHKKLSDLGKHPALVRTKDHMRLKVSYRTSSSHLRRWVVQASVRGVGHAIHLRIRINALRASDSILLILFDELRRIESLFEIRYHTTVAGGSAVARTLIFPRTRPIGLITDRSA